MANNHKQYKGRLTPSEIAEGITKANQNAERLYLDAKLLYEASRYPSSVALSILSIEESGKASILRSLSLSTTEEELKINWNRYRNHRAKNVHWIAKELIFDGARTLDDFSQVSNPDSEHPKLLDQLKQVALYTDCLGLINWSLPENVIDEKLAEELLELAGVFSNRAECSEQEVVSWIRHMLPVKDEPQNIQNQALYDWFLEMKDRGFISEGDIKLKDFLGIEK